MERLLFSILAMALGLSIALAALSIIPVQAAGNTYYVDDDSCPGLGTGTMTDPFCKIQDGIDVASSGDTVRVAPGTYYEHITMKSGVVIQGAGTGDEPSIHSIIDGGGTGSVVTASGVDSTAKLDGFKITNGGGSQGGGMRNISSSPTVINCTFSGNSTTVSGGVMYNSSFSSPTVTNCTFSGNSADDGGVMYNSFSSPTVTNCTFSGNSAAYGGVMYNYSSFPTVTNCTFFGNSADVGGVMSNSSSSPTVTNCTFFGNSATDYGGVMGNYSSSPTVTNCILWGDTPEEIYNFPSSSPVVTYSDIQGGYTGTGNINADPLFVDPDGPDNIPGNEDDDFHLSAGSPCIDTGTSSGAPDTDLEGNPRPQDGGYDMGAYEFLLAKTTAMPWILLLLGD